MLEARASDRPDREAAGGKVPVIAGASGNSTAATIESAKRVREAGADGALIATPYYDKPTQDGLVIQLLPRRDSSA